MFLGGAIGLVDIVDLERGDHIAGWGGGGVPELQTVRGGVGSLGPRHHQVFIGAGVEVEDPAPVLDAVLLGPQFDGHRSGAVGQQVFAELDIVRIGLGPAGHGDGGGVDGVVEGNAVGADIDDGGVAAADRVGHIHVVEAPTVLEGGPDR